MDDFAKLFGNQELSEEKSDVKITSEMINDIYKKTFGYSLDRVVVNDDGTTTHLHSDEFLDNHPKRVSSPEFTKEEEIEQLLDLAKIAQIF